MKSRQLQCRLVCWLLCLSLILEIPVPAMAQTIPEAAPAKESAIYTIYEDEAGLPQMALTHPASAALTHVDTGEKNTWYSLYEDLTADTLTVTGGSIQLILCDGATLTAGSIEVKPGSSLTIWGQPAQGGKLVTSSVTGDLTFNGGILETANKLTITGSLNLNDGKLSANGLEVQENLTVKSGFLDSRDAIHVKQDITVSDGFVTATGLHAGGNLTITGGQIESSLGCNGSMSVTNAIVITDKADASTSITSGVLVAPDSVNPNNLTGTVIGSPILGTDLVVLRNMKLDIPKDQTLTMEKGTTLTNLGTVTGEGAIKADSVVNADGCSIAGIDSKSITNAKPLSSCVSDNLEQYLTLDSGVYVLDQDMTRNKFVIPNGKKPTLILPNGLTLKASTFSREGKPDSFSTESLTLSEKSGPFGVLCSESKGLSFNIEELIVNGGMVSGNGGDIQAEKKLTVNGGTVSSTTKEKNAITVSGTLTVNGGSVQGTSQQKAGIHAECLTVKGGSVTGQNIKSDPSGQTSTDSTQQNLSNCGIVGNGNVQISGGIVASRDSINGKSDLSYTKGSTDLTGGVLLCCDMFSLLTKNTEDNKVTVTVKDTVIMTKTLLHQEDYDIKSGIIFSEENGYLVGAIKCAYKDEGNGNWQIIDPVIKTGFTIPERAILRIDHEQKLKLGDGVLHNKGDIVNLNTDNNIAGTITGNKPLSPIATYYMENGVRIDEVYAMELNQKILDLYGGSLPEDFPYILKESAVLELPQAILAPLKLILADGVEVHLQSNGKSVNILKIWGQEQNTGKLILEDPLPSIGSLGLYGGTISFGSGGNQPTLNTDSLDTGTNGTGWLTGTVQINNVPITDYSPYSGVFIHDNVVEVRGNQELKADYTVPAGHDMTVYGNLTIPQGVTLNVPEGTSVTLAGTLAGTGAVTGGGNFYQSDGTPGENPIFVSQRQDNSTEYTDEALDIQFGVKKFGQIWELLGWTGKFEKDNQSVTEVKDAGNYTITFSKEGEPTSFTKNFTVTPAAITGTIENVELVYNGKEQTVKPTGLNTNGNQPITMKYGTVEGTYNMDAITVKDAAAETYYYKATAPNHSEKTGSFTVTVRQSASEITDLRAYKGQTETTVFTYGDTITVKAKPTAIGTVPVQKTGKMRSMFSSFSSAPAANQMALFINGVQVSKAVSAGNDGYYVMTLNTTDEAVRAQLKPGQTTEVTAKFMGNPNMAESTGTISLTVNKAVITVTAEDKTVTYGAEVPSYTAAYTGFVKGDTAEKVLTGAPGFACDYTNTGAVGGYVITPSQGTLDSNYYTFTFVNGKVTVEKANAAVAQTPSANLLTYTGAAQQLVTAGTTEHGTIQYSLSRDTGYSASIPTGTNAGDYTVWYKVVGDGNHNDTDPVKISNTKIAKADYNMDGVTFVNATAVYDGQPHSLTVSKVPVGADHVPVTVTYSGSATNVSEGAVTVTATFATASTNYNVPAAKTATITIKRANPTPEMFTAGNLTPTYSGSELKPTVTAKSNITGMGAVTVNTKGTNVADKSNTISFSVAQGDNYNAADLTIGEAFAIQKADPDKTMFTVSGNIHSYDGSEHTAVVTANTGIVGMGTITVNTNGTNVADSKAIKITVAGGANYNAATLTLDETLTINTVDPTADMFIATNNVYTYDGKEHQPTVMVKDTVSGMGAVTVKTKATDAGSKAIEISVAEGANYNAKTITLEEKLTIHAKPIDGAQVALNGSLKYTGETLTQNVQSVTIDGLTATYTVKNNTGKDAGKYNMTITGNGNFKGSVTKEFTIAPHDALNLTAEMCLVRETPGYEKLLTLTSVSGYPADAGAGPVLVLGTQNLGANTTAVLENGVLKLIADNTITNKDGSVVIKLTGMKNYADSKITVRTKYVDKTSVSISGITVADRAYNGKPMVCTGTPIAAAGTQVVKPSGYTCTWQKEDGTVLNAAPTAVGTYKLVVAVNHTDAQYKGSVTIPFTISKKNVTVPAQAQPVTYNGKVQTYAVTSTEDYTVTAATQTNANEDGYDVTVALKDKANTQWANGNTEDLTQKFIINKAVVIVTADNQKAHIGKEQPANTYKTTGLFGNDQLTGTVIFTDNTANMNKVGTYTITPAGGDAGANYTIAYVNGTLTVEDHAWGTQWIHDETYHWHECTVCGAHKDEVEHSWQAPEFVFAADGKTATAKTTCECGQLHEKAAAVTYKITTPATCTLMGTTTYTAKVTLNGTEYTGTATRQNVAIDPANHNQQIVKIDAKDPTCTESGVKEHYKCFGCGKLYSDAEGNTEITLEEITIAAIGHKWGEPIITFSEDGKTATAVVTCENDKTHTQKLDAKVVSQVKTPATKETMGITTYSASVEFAGKTYTAQKNVQDISKIKPAETLEKVESQKLETVPESLKDTPYNTVEKIEKAMEKVLLQKIGEAKPEGKQKTTVFDAMLMVTENGVTRPATKEEVEARGGITIVIPYPAGTNRTDFVFTVAHMLTMDMAGMQAGDIETPEITLTDVGLKVTLKGLSPVMVGYSKKAAPTEPTAPETTVPGTTVPEATAPAKPDTPATGDTSHPAVWIGIMVLAAAGIASVLVINHKSKKKHNRQNNAK